MRIIKEISDEERAQHETKKYLKWTCLNIYNIGYFSSDKNILVS